MIKNFEKETSPLTEYEREELVPAVVKGLEGHVGKQLAVTNQNFIRKWMKGYKVNSIRLRKVINHIRVKGLLKGLMATSRGYYIAESREELEVYIESLKGREDAIRKLRQSIKRQMEKLYPKKDE